MSDGHAFLVGAIVTLTGIGLTIWASRRFGLPGLAREADKQSARLIERLRENNALLTKQNEALLAQNALLVTENRDLRVKLATAYDDIATLFRTIGQKVPKHITDTQAELADPGT